MPKSQHTVAAAAIRHAFTQLDRKGAQEVWRHVADQLRPRVPKLATLMDGNKADMLAYAAEMTSGLRDTGPIRIHTGQLGNPGRSGRKVAFRLVLA